MLFGNILGQNNPALRTKAECLLSALQCSITPTLSTPHPRKMFCLAITASVGNDDKQQQGTSF